MIGYQSPGFSGNYRDPVTGAYALGNGYRIYVEGLMRFNSADDWSPFGAGGLNPYAYCEGDPINYADPSGHAFFPAISDMVATGLRRIGRATRRSIEEDPAISTTQAVRASGAATTESGEISQAVERNVVLRSSMKGNSGITHPPGRRVQFSYKEVLPIDNPDEIRMKWMVTSVRSAMTEVHKARRALVEFLEAEERGADNQTLLRQLRETRQYMRGARQALDLAEEEVPFNEKTLGAALSEQWDKYDDAKRLLPNALSRQWLRLKAFIQ